MTLCVYTYSLLFSNCEEERREIKQTTKAISVTIVPYLNDTVMIKYKQAYTSKRTFAVLLINIYIRLAKMPQDKALSNREQSENRSAR